MTYEGELDYAFPPQSVTLTLEDEIDVSRGEMLVHPDNIHTAAAAQPSRETCQRALTLFEELTGVLGLVYAEDQQDEDADKIEAMIEARAAARKEKNWAESDRIRDELKAMGIVLEDTPQGVKWRRA